MSDEGSDLEPPAWWILDYTKSLELRAPTAVLVPRLQIQLDGWEPAANRCHDNAVQYADRMHEHTAVHGWLVFDVFTPPYFLAHSVVQRPDGSLIDITPSDALATHPFLRGEIPDWQYAALHKALFAKHGHGNLNAPY